MRPSSHPLTCEVDTGFVNWLIASGGSIAVSAYQANKLLFVGWNGSQISLLPRHFDKPTGLDIVGDQMVLATRHALVGFTNAQSLAQTYLVPGRYDSLFLPLSARHMPDLNIHDLAIVPDDVWMVVTRLSCLATLSNRHTLQPRWQPSFISELAPEDRCHLNGLAMVDGRPQYVTALGTSDQAGGWRANRLRGGVMMDVASQEIVAAGLCMPHSPRWFAGRLWLLNSGCGELLTLDPGRGKADVVCTLPGFLRGLCFVGDHALVGLSKVRETHIFGGMPVQSQHQELLCGVALVNLTTGRQTGMLRFTSGCSELYDLRFLTASRRPNVLNLDRVELTQALFTPESSYWLRPEFETDEVGLPEPDTFNQSIQSFK